MFHANGERRDRKYTAKYSYKIVIVLNDKCPSMAQWVEHSPGKQAARVRFSLESEVLSND